jgi:pimeloyl-ACP methyl ester carboxylesterase
MHQAILGSRFEVLTGAGHVSNLEQADEFNRILLDFLRTVEQ